MSIHLSPILRSLCCVAISALLVVSAGDVYVVGSQLNAITHNNAAML